MSTSRATRARLGGAVVAVFLALALGAFVPRPVAAAGVTFGTPSATSLFLRGIDFSQPVSGLSNVKYVEIAIQYPQALGPSVTQVANTGGSTLTYRLDTSKGGLVPNTPLVAHWRLTFTDGTQQVGPDVSVTYVDDRFQWKTKSSNLITLHWYQGDDAFATRALALGNQGVAKAASLLGATETKHLDFFVYADQQPFYDALGPGTRESVAGEAHADIRTLFALITPAQVNDSWVSVVVPHELTHIVFNDVVRNPYHFPAHWLDEGIAVYLTEGYDVTDRALVSNAIKAGTLMPLVGLVGQFPTVPDRFALAYGEAVSAVDFLVRTYGKPALVKLVNAYATGVSDDQAFKTAIGTDMKSFDTAWLASNGVTSPTKYGPQPAPAGAVPPGWGEGQGSVAPGASGQPGSGQATAAPDGQNASTNSQSGQKLVAAGLVGVAAVLLVASFVLWRRPRRDVEK